MRIRTKLILASVAVISFSILIVSIPVLVMQTHELKSNIEQSTAQNMSIATSDISAFLQKARVLVNDMASYLKFSEVDEEATIQTFIDAISEDKALYSLYYADTVPMQNGGIFYSNDYWTPDSSYDKTTRDWYAESITSEHNIITEPYVDADTGSLVTSVAKAIRKDGKIKGVVSLDILLDDLTGIVSVLKISSKGESFLLDSNGFYLTNPDSKKILTKNFFDENPSLKKYQRQASNTAFLQFNAGNGNYFASQQIDSENGWQLVTIGPYSELYRPVQRTINVVIIMALIAISVGNIMQLIFAKHIVQPIVTVDKAVNSIAQGNANLTQRLTVQSKDEIGSLVNGFNKFIEKLQNLVSEIKNSEIDLNSVEHNLQERVQDAASSITEILSNIESVGNQVNNQAEAVQQTSAAVAEIAENINSLENMISRQADGVSQASAAVEQMVGNIESVNHNVELMTESFEKLESNAQIGIERQKSVSEQVNEVAEQSKTLQEANKAIASVASQTNLLAMNAAIEAAHAGEAGKGFSVVADEIRKLSETSSAQSRKIGSELKKIQETISAVVASSHESSQSFYDVNAMITNTDELVRQIHAAMEEQQEGSKQIVKSLKIMNDNTAEVRTASHEMAEGNRLILDEVHNLQDTTLVIKQSMKEMSVGAKGMNGTSSALSEISNKVRESITTIGSEIDQFKV